MFDEKLVTIWSAPNYCYRCGNMASILVLNEKLFRSYFKFRWADRQIPEGMSLVFLWEYYGFYRVAVI